MSGTLSPGSSVKASVWDLLSVYLAFCNPPLKCMTRLTVQHQFLLRYHGCREKAQNEVRRLSVECQPWLVAVGQPLNASESLQIHEK